MLHQFINLLDKLYNYYLNYIDATSSIHGILVSMIGTASDCDTVAAACLLAPDRRDTGSVRVAESSGTPGRGSGN